MALNKELKENIAGAPAEPSQEKAPQPPLYKPYIGPNFTPPSSTPQPSVDKAEAADEAAAPEGEAGSEQLKQLTAIESRLQALAQSVHDLEQAVKGQAPPDYQAVFDKIDSARIGIEKLLAAPPQPAAAPEADSQQMPALLQAILEKQEKNDRQLTQMLRENATFQIQVRQGMQHDLDILKSQLNGEQFNPLLKEIASVYAEYQYLLDDEGIPARSRKNLESLFEQLEDILGDYEAEVCQSEIGSARQTRTCKVIEKIPIGDPKKHNTIAASRKPGVVRGRSVLYPEFVDVFVYDSSLADGGEASAESDADQTAAEPACDTPADSAESIHKDLGGNEA